MTFLKNNAYLEIIKRCFEYFENNFKTEKTGSHPSDYEYKLLDIPNTLFKAVDVYYNKRFFRRYLIIIVRNGDISKISPESYEGYLEEHLCNLLNPVGGFYPQGVALFITDNKNMVSNFLLQKDMKSVNCGS